MSEHSTSFGPVVEVPGWRHIFSGKVRDLYEPLDGDTSRVLVVASDRISAFDHVLTTPIPDKGTVLTALSLWWFEQLAPLTANHVLSLDVPEQVVGRAMICQRLSMFGVECVARGYLTGSGLLEYQESQTVCAVPLPAGLVDGSRLDEPIFTPATKAELGNHDENVSFDQVVETIGTKPAHQLRALTLSLYSFAEGLAHERGVILADTKFEFGTTPDGELVLGDEVLTPDSSRYWPADQWSPGSSQASFDKQFVRNWLTSPESGWDRTSDTPPPPLPEQVVTRTRERYIEAYERLTGHNFTV